MVRVKLSLTYPTVSVILRTALNMAKANQTTNIPETRTAAGSTNFTMVATEESTSREYCTEIFAQILLIVEVFSAAPKS